MNRKQTVCLLIGSFPPVIDGVANTVMNYAAELPGFGYESMNPWRSRRHIPTRMTVRFLIRLPGISTQKF